MRKPPRICSCGDIVADGELCDCQMTAKRERDARHDANRPNAGQRGYNHEWRKARADYLLAHPFCRECAKHQVYTPATVVDHVIPHRGDKRLFWHRANWQPLCAPCHNSVKQRQERELQ
ncbi:5-methylcytosine-specific restriction endonuclease McrA [Peteryoungia aggregata LMG 23059]|uniref:Putative HNH nuclease YajD n=1 Tax=Peteryoungia aggregata LMG 23059 TaxID=1368425 RepID=A0ABU0G712_9HYPH|nr:HNH endonuclease signature motif containing protein [Peteryoungia aggregata]MDQ0421107.1 5-methylcytosine-specific restriction endonuclease McrA [Peteryoungia aggregata LMG 23059]